MKNHTPLNDQEIRRPIDRTAKRVISKGVHFTPQFKKRGANFSKMQPEIEPYRPTNPDAYDDLTGVKFGRFTVVGMAKFDGKQQRWVAKCTCGNYEKFKPGTILNFDETNKNTRIMCLECVKNEKIKRSLNKFGDRIVRECPFCGKKFFSRQRTYCSSKCRHLASGREWVDKPEA